MIKYIICVFIGIAIGYNIAVFTMPEFEKPVVIYYDETDTTFIHMGEYDSLEVFYCNY